MFYLIRFVSLKYRLFQLTYSKSQNYLREYVYEDMRGDGRAR